MRWWVDDSDFQADGDIGTPDVLVYGGIAIGQDAERDLVRQVQRIKGKYGHPHAPVKWNFRDLAKSYQTTPKGEALYERMKDSADAWRQEIFEAIGASGATLIVGAIDACSPDRQAALQQKADCIRQVFTNVLMRFALHVHETGSQRAQVVIALPPGNVREPLNREYRSAFLRGLSHDDQKYLAGPLSKIGFDDAPLFTTMQLSCMLQLADLTVGATRSFLRACLREEEHGPGLDCLRRVRERFRGAPDHVAGRGLNLTTTDQQFRARVGEAIRHGLFEVPRG